MSRLVTILRAAHCRSTHHYFAIDALSHIGTAGGQRLGQCLLKYHDEYLVGAKAPDKSFKDFQNHVIHVQDDNWGGAPAACEKWLAQTIEYLDAQNWKKAAYACGVLSHYFTDPFMPLHTAQSDREAVVHRPLEWSVCKSYEEILPLSVTMQVPPIELASGPEWISKAVIQGAQRANKHYSSLVDNYDLERGCKQPTEGFDTASRKILAELFQLTTTTWAKVLARIADETTSDVPECSLGLTTLLATIDMPLAWVVRRVSDTYEQIAVKALLREFNATGTVRRHLPSEVKKVAVARAKPQDSHQSPPQTAASPTPAAKLPVVVPPAAVPAAESELPASTSPEIQPPAIILPSTGAELDATHHAYKVDLVQVAVKQSVPAVALRPIQPVSEQPVSERPVTERPVTEQQMTEQQMTETPLTKQPVSEPQVTEQAFALAPKVNSAQRGVAEESRVAALRVEPTPAAPRANPRPEPIANFESPGLLRRTVSADSALVKAPSIGPKTARRFENIGIRTIGDFLAASAAEMQVKLDTRWITEELLREWQEQAQLVCDLPTLCGYKAQLLVAANCRTAAELARSVPRDLTERINRVCLGIDGQRILRSSPPPTASDISEWISDALEHNALAAA